MGLSTRAHLYSCIGVLDIPVNKVYELQFVCVLPVAVCQPLGLSCINLTFITESLNFVVYFYFFIFFT